jgi:Zn-finger nucleic acid-binding protein
MGMHQCGGVWLELGQAEMALAQNREDNMTPAAMAPMLAPADKAYAAAREVLAMRGQ